MPDQRAAGKKLIGAQASAELWRGIDEWLRLNPRLSVTDFVLAACVEKLGAAQIRVDSDAVFRDNRTRQPAALPSAHVSQHASPHKEAAKLVSALESKVDRERKRKP